jgi:hypothetical protein
LATPVWGEDISRQVHNAVAALDAIKDIREVTDPLVV